MWATLQSPDDAISCVRFGPSDFLLSSSWDKTVSVYDTNSESCLAKFELRAAVLACAWQKDGSGNHCFAGGAESRVAMIDVNTGVISDIGGEHHKPISGLAYNASISAVITGSFDKTLQLIDCRAHVKTQPKSSPAAGLPGIFYEVGAKVFAVDSSAFTVVAALEGCNVHVYDARRLSEPLSVRHYAIGHPLRSVRCNSTGTLFASSSVASRVSVESTNNDPQSKCDARGQHTFESIRFRAHRRELNSSELEQLGCDSKEGVDCTLEAMPIHALAFNPAKPELATGGSDKTVQLWDLENSKRTQTYAKLSYSVMSLDYSLDGQKLAVALSDDAYCRTPTSGVDALRSALMVRA